jgi:hypothetical protein
MLFARDVRQLLRRNDWGGARAGNKAQNGPLIYSWCAPLILLVFGRNVVCLREGGGGEWGGGGARERERESARARAYVCVLLSLSVTHTHTNTHSMAGWMFAEFCAYVEKKKCDSHKCDSFFGLSYRGIKYTFIYCVCMCVCVCVCW